MSDSPRAAVQPAPQPQRLRRLPSWLVNQVALRATRLTASMLGSTVLRSDFAVLAGLEEFGPLSQAELGRRLGMDRSDIVAVLDRLQAGECVERTADSLDRRRKTVALTDVGRSYLNDLDAQLGQVQDALLEPLTAPERAQLMALLGQVLDKHSN
ncbi:MarR family winged helix-turn-helix transcriptional regulator [Arthrobacter sp. ISL-30]|uniref:MarR family winged helix-turn-helix transcriptional regulator n=1 Tax=Arthrobacter sp. ISL-30 TaxID=2819109 RepID=UPI001BE4E706|nr:MarR family transcriptional regulator [Arthrobacter sp. ISL-30]MBT2513650.1 MarR family transcriptional regulator [Arthrobacter sp. ISL-30]